MPNHRKVIARLDVKETAGMRRFLYPLAASIRGDFERSRIRVADESGNLVPSQSSSVDDLHSIQFAVSMAPHEVLRLNVVETDQVPVIPDPIDLKFSVSGDVESRQNRFSQRIDSDGRLASVVYAGVEHLAGPAIITLDDIEGRGTVNPDATVGDGLGGTLTYGGDYGHPDGKVGFTTGYTLTACKSWICVHHMLHGPTNGSRVVFSLPTTTTGSSTCDFGVGNGLYGHLRRDKIDRISWRTDLGDQTSWRLESGVAGGASMRVDAEGSYQGSEPNLDARSWFHLNGRDRALAVAFYADPKRASHIEVLLGEDGLVRVAFTVEKHQPSVSFVVWYHFLDDIPPFAAATNPASILLPPTVTVLPV